MASNNVLESDADAEGEGGQQGGVQSVDRRSLSWRSWPATAMQA
jgi:hypothetical protein